MGRRTCANHRAVRGDWCSAAGIAGGACRVGICCACGGAYTLVMGTPRSGDDLRNASRGERLQRVLADAGVASRRACESLILEGRVRVNGRRVDALPAWVDPKSDRIEVDGERVAEPERHVYIMLNKPGRTISSVRDEAEMDRRTVVSMVDHPASPRLFPVGRLDFHTQGLILLTNDGDLANRITHPRYGLAKTYRAVVRGALADEDIEALEQGIYLAERREGRTVGATRTARVAIRIVSRHRDRTTIDITLKEGRNRQVRRMLAAAGCPVKKLERIAVGPLALKGVPRGGWRELTRAEVQGLRRATRPGSKNPNDNAPSRQPATRARRRPSRTTRGGGR